MTPVKDQKTPTSKLAGRSKASENANPNSALPASTPPSKTKSRKPAPGIAHRVAPVAMQGRKFLVAKKTSKKEASSPSMASLDGRCNCKEKQIGVRKCRCVAYESLRASQEEFFKSRAMAGGEGGKEIAKTEEEGDNRVVRSEAEEADDSELSPDTTTSSRIRKIKNRLMEEARSSIPELGLGRVKHLTDAFERLLSIRKSGGGDDQDKAKLGFKWEILPGMQGKDPESTDLSSSTGSLPPPDFVFTAKPTVSSSFDSSKR